MNHFEPLFPLGILQRKVDEISRLSETRRKEQERNFRLVCLKITIIKLIKLNFLQKRGIYSQKVH